MSAQPYEPGPAAQREPTIRSVRAALPEVQRPLFQAEIERTPLHQLGDVLRTWDLRARAMASPEIVAAAAAGEAYLRGHGNLDLLGEDEIRQRHPELRP